MSPQTKTSLWVLGVFAALVSATVGVATVLVAKMGIGATAASFCAAALVASSVAVPLGIYGECYQRWARAHWGAPFNVGDRVRIVRGPGAGAEAIVVGLGQGVQVEVEFDSDGNRERRLLLWVGLRRIGPARPNTA